MVEITFVGEDDEAYVNVDEDGTIGTVYFYHSSPLGEIFAHHAGKNPLFVHADEPAAVFEYLRKEYNVTSGDLEAMRALGYACE